MRIPYISSLRCQGFRNFPKLNNMKCCKPSNSDGLKWLNVPSVKLTSKKNRGKRWVKRLRGESPGEGDSK